MQRSKSGTSPWSADMMDDDEEYEQEILDARKGEE